MTAAAAQPARRGKTAPAASGEHVFDAKIRPPALPAGFVARPRVERLVTQGTQRRLTLVSAHAGTGKTVLLSAWEQRAPANVAWVSIGRTDNVEPRLWLALELALDRAGAPPGPVRGDSRRRRRKAETDAALPIVERLDALSEPITIVLDDFHELESPAVLAGVDTLVRLGPPQVRFVVSTRADPAFPLHRLRLAGELTEIRAAELAFSRDEARGLLGEAGERLSDDGLDMLCEHTEGWAAGLRLAALSLPRSPDGDAFVAAFAGDDRSVADYLVSEVLAQQSAERREFLLTTSVAARLPTELASLLSGRADAFDLLEQLEAENLFVGRQGASRLDFRYHRLFREFLRAELARSKPELVPVLHARAAAWYSAHGEPFSALKHAVAAQAWEVADEVAAETWEELLPVGNPAGLRAVLEPVSGQALQAFHSLGLLVGVNLLDAGEAADGISIVDRSLAALDSGTRAESSLAAYAAAAAARRRGDPHDAARSAQALLARANGAAAGSLRPAHVQRAVGGTSLGAALLAVGDLDAAERALDLGHELARAEHLESTVVDALGQLALLEAARGRLRRAADFGGQAAALAERHGSTGGLDVVAGQLALAWAHFHWDEPDEAERHVGTAAAGARTGGDASGALAAALVGALLDATRGAAGADRGLRRLRSALDDTGSRGLPHFLVPSLATAEARLLATRGDLDAAWAALDEVEPIDEASRAGRAAVRARLLLAWGRPRQALAELVPESGAPELEFDTPQTIERELLAAVAHAEEHEREVAADRLARALELAGVDRYRRVFVEGGPAVRALLVDSVRHGTPHRSFVAELLAAFERRAPGVEITKPELLEPLSARERAVLRYLPTLMSNTEIAGELFLSVNTVKTHLRSIYRKLGATRRRDAVERARRLELL